MQAKGKLSIAALLVAAGSIGIVASHGGSAMAQITRGESTGLSIFERQSRAVSASSFPATSVVERLLTVNGFSAGEVDGILDNDTRQAIRTFERQNGLTENGQIDLELVTALAAHALDLIPGAEMRSSVPTGASSIVADNILRATRARVQRILARNGFEPGRIDGINNDLTTQAIRDFQSQVGLPVNGVVSTELLNATSEFDRFATQQIRLPLSQLSGVLNRPGFAADLVDQADIAEGGWALRTIANGQLIPVDGVAGAVQMDGFLVASQTVENERDFRFSALDETDGDTIHALTHDRVALNWGGFLNVIDTGPFEFGIQVNLTDQQVGSCNFVLMLNENNRLFTILNLRIDQSTPLPQRALVFLEAGFHQLELWTQCDVSTANEDFVLNLLMRRPGAGLLQPIQSEFIWADATENFFLVEAAE